jgi:hypothetical protein
MNYETRRLLQKLSAEITPEEAALIQENMKEINQVPLDTSGRWGNNQEAKDAWSRAADIVGKHRYAAAQAQKDRAAAEWRRKHPILRYPSDIINKIRTPDAQTRQWNQRVAEEDLASPVQRELVNSTKQRWLGERKKNNDTSGHPGLEGWLNKQEPLKQEPAKK